MATAQRGERVGRAYWEGGLTVLIAALLAACSGGADAPTPSEPAAEPAASDATAAHPEAGQPTPGQPTQGMASSDPTQATAATATAHLPDACGLVTQADLESLYPKQPVTKEGSEPSPLHLGPQYTQSCMYKLRLPNPRMPGNVTKFVSTVVIQTNAQTSDFAYQFDLQSKMKNIGNRRIERVDGIANEAFQMQSDHEVAVWARKDGVIYRVSTDNYSEQTLPNMLALARQAAARWSSQDGMTSGSSALASNAQVDVPPDQRESMQAPASEWPDACAMLVQDDVAMVIADSDTEIEGPTEARASLSRMGRKTTAELLPHPIGCSFNATERKMVDGKREIETSTINLRIDDMASRPEFAQRFFKVVGGKTEIPGVADEARFNDSPPTVSMRKGRLVVSLRVSSSRGGRHQDARDRDIARVKALAAKVAARMP